MNAKEFGLMLKIKDMEAQRARALAKMHDATHGAT